MSNYTTRFIDNQEVLIKLEKGRFENYKFIVQRVDGKTVGLKIDEKEYLLSNRVEIRADSDGRICAGIMHEGLGTITRIKRNGTDHYFGVQMDDGEFGYVSVARIWKVIAE